MGECNETIVSLEQCRDIYGEYLDKNILDSLIKTYDINGRQLYYLSVSWKNFKEKGKPTS